MPSSGGLWAAVIAAALSVTPATNASPWGPPGGYQPWGGSGQGWGHPGYHHGNGYGYVQTTTGKIIGHTAHGAANVTEFLGIPYAQPPLGDLRFAPPATFSNPAQIVHADNFRHDCPTFNRTLSDAVTGRLRTWLTSANLAEDVYDEDCLYLNLWAPASVVSEGPKCEKPLPVLIWFFGGGFNEGGTNTSLYNGQYFAAYNNVLLVSVNYRTNIFGFPGAPNVVQNAGVLDQRLAVEWVRDNIHAFGGDPSRIIIFGQSAGAASVDIYNFAWAADPIIAGSIQESGTISGLGVHSAETSATEWFNASSHLGCGDASSDPAAVLACMRSDAISWPMLVNASQAATSAGNAAGSSFYPTVDGVTVFANYTQLLLDGAFVRKPMLQGSNNYEAGLFLLGGGVPGLTPATVRQFDDSIFTCPASTSTQGHANAGLPTWRYYYGGMFPNILLPSVNLSQAYHSAEISIVFMTSGDASGEAPTAAEVDLGFYVQGAWAAFAHDPVAGLAEYGWPTYDPSTDSLVLLGIEQATTASFTSPADVDADCGAYPYPGAGVS